MGILGIEILEELEKLDPPLRSVFIKILKNIEKLIGETVKRDDFLRLTNIVENLAEELRSLAEAQRKTEERLNELAEAQKKTEERLNELADEVKRLAEAQRKTEEELGKLIKEHEKTRKDLGGLTHTFGYFLENESYKYLPALLERDYNLKVIEPLDRRFIEYTPNRYDEINIFGKGMINGKEVYILGEVKSQLSKRHIDEFLKKIARIKRYYSWETFLVLVTHMPVNPQVEKYAKELGIALYKSSQFR